MLFNLNILFYYFFALLNATEFCKYFTHFLDSVSSFKICRDALGASCDVDGATFNLDDVIYVLLDGDDDSNDDDNNVTVEWFCNGVVKTPSATGASPCVTCSILLDHQR